MTAKTEIAGYSVSTRFGGGRRIVHDKPVPRPTTRIEAISQIEKIYRENGWRAPEQKSNCRLVGLTPKPLEMCDNAELKIILDDMEKFGMILYEK